MVALAAAHQTLVDNLSTSISLPTQKIYSQKFQVSTTTLVPSLDHHVQKTLSGGSSLTQSPFLVVKLNNSKESSITISEVYNHSTEDKSDGSLKTQSAVTVLLKEMRNATTVKTTVTSYQTDAEETARDQDVVTVLSIYSNNVTAHQTVTPTAELPAHHLLHHAVAIAHLHHPTT